MLRFIVLGFLIFCFSSISYAASVDWIYSYDEAMKKSAAENKPVMMDLYTEWCGWCKKLDRETYQDAKVVELSRNFVCLKIDAEKEPRLAEKYSIRGYPTIFFTDSQGNVIGGGPGFKDAAGLLAEMNAALQNKISDVTK